MYKARKYKLNNWYGFDDKIFYSAKRFYRKYGYFANVVVFNKHTYEQICFIISISPLREGLVDDTGEEEVRICKMVYLDSSLRCAIADYLKDKEFQLIHDDENDDDDDDENDINPFISPEVDTLELVTS